MDKSIPQLWFKQPLAAASAFFAITLPTAAQSCPPLLQHRLPVLQDGKPESFCQSQGKFLLVVVGFPSNDFGGQEQDGNQEVAAFCRLTYAEISGVTA